MNSSSVPPIPSPHPQAEATPTRLMLIDDDPIFRLGLRTALEAFPDLQVVAEADTRTQALEILESLQPGGVDAVVLELAAISRSDPNPLSELPLCQRLKVDYANLPVLLLTAQVEPLLLKAAQDVGIEGYCPKGCAIAEIVQAIHQIVSGQTYWQQLPEVPNLTNTVRSPSWHHQLRTYGLRQIADSLALVTQELQRPNLSNLDWLFWSGRRRELLVARWVVNQLLPADVIVVEREKGKISQLPSRSRMANHSSPSNLQTLSRDRYTPSLYPQSASLAPLPSSISQPTTPFDVTLATLQSSLSNLSGVPLEIDILDSDKKRDLLYIVIRKLEEILEELRFSGVTSEQLPQKRSQILLDLWQATVTDFFGKYYTLQVGNQNLEVVNVLLSVTETVQRSILDKIPMVVELLAQQLFAAPLIIDNVSYPGQTPEAQARAETLLQNLIIQVANAVIQPLLNEFADIEIIKQNFYDLRLISSREITRFRNNLSWRYRLLQWVEEPKAIFESRYNLFVLSDTGIKQVSIYAPRRQELEQLQGIPLAVTLAFETRDAIAPRLRSTVAWAGKGVVYVLTQVIGRSIGLVVRGVMQGVGNSLQETRFGKNGERGK